MRKNFLILIVGIGLVSLGAFSFIVGKQVSKMVKSYYATHAEYQPITQDQVKVEKSFVVVITAENNELQSERNMRSVLEQNYENYRIVFIDNGSDDKTYFKANEWIRKFGQSDKVTFIRNVDQRPMAEVLYFAIQDIANDEIVIMLDGKDWLAHKEVFNELNRYYNDDNVWMTYAQYASFPEYKRGDARESIIKASKQIALRASPWIYSHYCSFYAGLFKRIKMKDLLYEGSFFKYKSNRAILMPMLEMAEEHAVFVPEILYINNRNVAKEQTDDEMKCIRAYSRYIRSLKPYTELKAHPKFDIVSDGEADLVVFSTDRPLQLYSFLESSRKYGDKVCDIYVVYSASDEKFDQGYQQVKRHFPEVYFLHIEPHQTDLKKNVISLIKKATSAHIAIAQDQFLLKDHLELGRAISLMDKTGAYGFYFSLGLNLSQVPSRYYDLTGGILAWQFNEGEAEWNKSNSFGMTLYRKDELVDGLSRLSFSTLEELQDSWDKTKNTGELGLCFSQSRSIMNMFEFFRARKGEKETAYTQEELNDLFLEGLKLDIKQMHRLRNKEMVVEILPHFIDR